MSFAKRFNTTVVHFDYETPTTHEYIKPERLVATNGLEKVYNVNALYINTKGSFDDEPVIVTNDELVNAPSHLTNQVQKILKDKTAVKAINDGLVGFMFYEYESKKYGTNYSIKWVDIEPNNNDDFVEGEELN